MSWLLGRLTASAPDVPSETPSVKQNKALGLEEYEQRADTVGLLVTKELDNAIERCKAKVARISTDCRRRNRRFRDIEFDLKVDTIRTIHSLDQDSSMEPKDILRLNKIFDKPEFFMDGPSSSDIRQGGLANCWFLSALATVSSRPDLIEKICVARDEVVGVYGFIFYTDAGWVDVVVDDYLCVAAPHYEALSSQEQQLYKYDWDIYNSIARKGSKTLFFSSSTDENETWVPLIEKAYAKLYGDYKAVAWGVAGDGIEDLTGGVTTRFFLSDILDPELFWREELCAVNQDCLFDCSVNGIDIPNGSSLLSNGLLQSHSYAIIGTREVAGKRFVKIRNPWAKSEWSGKWGDGSKEWTKEWLDRLPELDHKFGDDGEFLMEYSDFLDTWSLVSKTRLLDSSWAVSTHWLNVTTDDYPSPWGFGDVSFTFNISDQTPVILVLARANPRGYSDISGPFNWNFDFELYKKGGDELIGTSSHNLLFERTVSMDMDLPAGEYVVHVRLDRAKNPPKDTDNWGGRKLSRLTTAKTLALNLVSNVRPSDFEGKLPLPAHLFPGRDLTEIELTQITEATKPTTISSLANLIDSSAPESTEPVESTVAVQLESKDTTTETQVPVTSAEVSMTESKPADGASPNESPNADLVNEDVAGEKIGPLESGAENHAPSTHPQSPASTKPTGEELVVHEGYSCDICKTIPIVGARYRCLETECVQFDLCPKCMDAGVHPASHKMIRYGKADDESRRADHGGQDDDNSIILGLRVYTKSYAPALVRGQLRHGKVLRWTKPSTKEEALS